MQIRLLLCVIIFFLAQTIFATELTPVEKKIRDEVIANKTAQINLLARLVNIDSNTTNPSGVYKVGEIIKNELAQMGFQTTWVNEPSVMQRAPTLVAKHKGKVGGPRLLLIGHLDTVYGGTDAHFTVEQHSGKGAGTIDDKGGLVVMLYALKALFAADVLKDQTITVVLTGDEEDSGKPTSISRKPLFAAATESDFALDFEPSVSLNTATIARRGITNWTVRSTGVEAHSATIFQKNVGDGAIFELARVLTSMRTELQHEQDLSFNPGLILGGMNIEYDKAKAKGDAFGKQNVIAKTALATGDVRFLSKVQEQAFKTNTERIVKNHLPATHSTIDFVEGIPAMSPSANNLKLLTKYSKASADLGLGVVKPLPAGLRGAGDISHIAAQVSANLAGLGPIGDEAHARFERIDLDSLAIQTERAAIFIYRCSPGERSEPGINR